jgi:hypothetical protein
MSNKKQKMIIKYAMSQVNKFKTNKIKEMDTNNVLFSALKNYTITKDNSVLNLVNKVKDILNTYYPSNESNEVNVMINILSDKILEVNNGIHNEIIPNDIKSYIDACIGDLVTESFVNEIKTECNASNITLNDKFSLFDLISEGNISDLTAMYLTLLCYISCSKQISYSRNNKDLNKIEFTDEDAISVIFSFVLASVNFIASNFYERDYERGCSDTEKKFFEEKKIMVDGFNEKTISLEKAQQEIATLKDKYAKLQNSLEARVDKKVDKISKSLTEEKKSLASENNRLKLKIQELQEKNNNLQSIVDKQAKQTINNEKIETLNKTIKKLTEQNNSLKKLTSNPVIEKTINNIEQDFPEDKTIDMNRSILFIGGHTTTLENLCSIYSKADCVSNETTELNQSYMNSFDGIVFLTDFLSHNLYKKIKRLADKYNIKYIHCKKNNVDLIVDDIESNF